MTCAPGSIWSGVFTDACRAATLLGKCPDDPEEELIEVGKCPEIEPRFGSPCSQEATCYYGEECCCGKCSSSKRITCSLFDDGTGVWNGFFTDACLFASRNGCPGDDVLTECPATRPQSGSPCPETVELECSYGEECCCGKCHPSLQFSCTPGSVWVGFFTDACLKPSIDGICAGDPEPECPATEPETGSPCPESGRLFCTYGEECCCGECHASLQMTCEPGSLWSGVFTDACRAATLLGKCPDDPEEEIIEVRKCPETQPQFGSPCSQEATCSYGEECCCGECSSSVRMTCSLFDDGTGVWRGLFTDACLFASRNGCPGDNVLEIRKVVRGRLLTLSTENM